MVDPEWQGGKKEQRLYRKVRAEKQKVIRKKYDVIQAHLNERGRRLWAGSEAISFGQGGIRAVAETLAMSQKAVIQGRRELEGKSPGKPGEGVLTGGRQRRAGGGRKPAVERQPGLVEAIETIVNPATRGDPMRPLNGPPKAGGRSAPNSSGKDGKSVPRPSVRSCGESWTTACKGSRRRAKGRRIRTATRSFSI